jgi:hypothetical protein
MEHAYGNNYLISDAPFVGQDGTSHQGKPWLLLGSRESGIPHEVQAGKAPVLCGGEQYNTVKNGWSTPVIIQPGEKVTVTLRACGDAYNFAHIEVNREPCI